MEIKITKSARACSECERPFEHGEEIFSLIRLQDQAFVRNDYDKTHWGPEKTQDAVAVWSTAYVDPKYEAQQPPEVFSPLRQAFYEAAESKDRAEIAKAYLAAQLLRRQKVFRLVKEFDSDEGDVRLALFADRIGNRFIEVGDPNLSYQELETGRQALLHRLRELEAAQAGEETGAETQTGEVKTDSTEMAHEAAG
ncbi:MAG TPA: hypothetical protein PLD73_08540 [Candidatus Hydrogenedentes bacterium]|jgi:hypothetical protein|nr:hypothetical protein [Candidatus Hydrogenedentota bacterium]HPK00144.1 hypothetical protein [Candidatus Hydrogenedentota bacterium]